MLEPQALTPFGKLLRQQFADTVRYAEPLATHTTLRLGGPARYFLPVYTTTELVQAVTLAREHDEPLFMLGGGANVLITDVGFAGLVIQNRTRYVEFSSLDEISYNTPHKLRVDSGVILPSFARKCARRGLTGFEWAVGVPGTMGGAVVNNAGAYGQDMRDSLSQAELLSPTGERVWQPMEWFSYGYRSSRLKGASSSTTKNSWVVLRAELKLSFAPPEEIKSRMQVFNEQRKATQPPGATLGSMFKNPPGDYAGRLIEAAGLKGHRCGQAQISKIHANFFKNLGGATATDVLTLIKTAQEAVKQKFGVSLALEIEVIDATS